MIRLKHMMNEAKSDSDGLTMWAGIIVKNIDESATRITKKHILKTLEKTDIADSDAGIKNLVYHWDRVKKQIK